MKKRNKFKKEITELLLTRDMTATQYYAFFKNALSDSDYLMEERVLSGYKRIMISFAILNKYYGNIFTERVRISMHDNIRYAERELLKLNEYDRAELIALRCIQRITDDIRSCSFDIEKQLHSSHKAKLCKAIRELMDINTDDYCHILATVDSVVVNSQE